MLSLNLTIRPNFDNLSCTPQEQNEFILYLPRFALNLQYTPIKCVNMKGYIKIGVEQGLISFNDAMSRIIYIYNT